MGGNTYRRQSFTDSQIKELVEKAVNNPLVSLRSDKIFSNIKQWRADIARLLDHSSSIKFYFYLATYSDKYHCHHCTTELGIQSFDFIHKMFSKYCPECTAKGVWRSNLTKDKLKQRGAKIATAKLSFYQTEKGFETAKNNGKKISSSLRKFHESEKGAAAREKSRIHNSALVKERILNGTFTPNSNNRNTHWNTIYNGKLYRSSWEAIYQYHFPDDLHEKLRIEYQYSGKTYIYIVDFINYNTNIVTEVKPIEMCSNEKFTAKYSALVDWCSKNGFTPRIATLDFLQALGAPSDMTLFDENTQRKIKKIYDQT
jgi:hypothetical protein